MKRFNKYATIAVAATMLAGQAYHMAYAFDGALQVSDCSDRAVVRCGVHTVAD